MAWTRRGLLAAVAIGGAAPRLAWAADQDSEPLWEVRDGRARVFVCGEGASPPTAWRSARIQSAFDQSAILWKETPDASAAVKTPAFLAVAIDKARPLSTWLSEAQRARVAAAAETVGMTYGFLEPFRPWAAGQGLYSSMARRFGGVTANGPEPVLTRMAQAAGKPIQTEFADYKAAIDLFADFPALAQVQYLSMAVDWIDEGADMWRRRATAWSAGDLGVETGEVDRMRRTYPELYQDYVVVRNRRWPGRIRAILDEGQTGLVLVGCDHLVGPDSVLVQLNAAGMRARRV